MNYENLQLDTIASGKGDETIEVATYDRSRYDIDNAELTRLGKKPVLKVCRHFVEDRICSNNSAKFWIYFDAGIRMHGDDNLGRCFTVRQTKPRIGPY